MGVFEEDWKRKLVFERHIYTDLSCEMKVGAGQSDPFEVSCGLRQGCILSPLILSFHQLSSYKVEGD